MALGAGPGRALRSVLLSTLLRATIGAGLGLAAASVSTRWLESLVYEVSVRDLPVFGASALLLVVVAAGASLVPARRAASIHPAETLRAES
jgi:ABC-type lipoprotein release transport system permease subunit